MRTLPAPDSSGVTPRLRPTVAKAEVVSNRRSRNGISSVVDSSMVTVPISSSASTVIVSALKTRSWLSR
ncbi:hypothetical protein D3C73_1333920 [compost metagenome]